MNFDKTKTASITLILMLTFSATILALPIVSAHDPAWEVPTWAYISASPNPLGVGQPALLVMWINQYPPTASGANGDRWDGYTVEVTTPDGSKETLQIGTSDPVGSAYAQYTPTQVGTYTFVFHFPGDIVTGEPFPPDWTPFSFGADTIGDIYLASSSAPVTLTVQQDPIAGYEETPLPEGYWERPIYGANRNWWQISGNWLAGANNPGRFNRYTNAPESAHILWAKQYWDGGLMGGQFGSIGYYTGMSYESFGLSPPIILNGRLYYNVETPPVYGWYCLDLYTGETLYFHNTTGPITGITFPGTGFDESGAISEGALSFGQIYDYESPNQHGGFPYLWSAGQVAGFFAAPSRTWQMFDAFTGNYICTIENVSAGGTSVLGKDGSILRYNIVGTPGPTPFSPSTPPYYLQVWNTSRAIWYREFSANTYWMWRPYLNYTFDGNNGFSLNVTIPDVSGSIRAVVEGEYLIGGTSGKHNSTYVEDGELWALSLVEGQEGTLLWKYSYTPPETVVPDVVAGGFFGGGLMQGPTVDVENGVFLFSQAMTRERWGYDLATGNMLWGPTEPEPQWNFYGMSTSIAYGKLFGYGYGGKLIAYDIRTGEEVWNWRSGTLGFETPYENVPLSLGCIADGKIYMYSSEHSPTMPLRRDAYLWCIDAETGVEIWKMQCWANNPAIADGYIVTLDSFDNRIYCYGIGPSATTVTVPESVQPLGTTVLLKGTVTDQSPGAKGTPAISDADQQMWMEYLYQQRPLPQDAEGVEVVLTTLDPNGNSYEIGRATSDTNGNYGVMWEPPVPGQYKIIATFKGSAAYGSSDATTYLGVTEAPSPAAAIEPEQPAAPSPAAAFAPTEPTPTETPLITTEIAIIAAVAVACVIGIVAFWALRKRK